MRIWGIAALTALGCATAAASESTPAQSGFLIAQSSVTALAQRLIPLRFQGWDFSPYADAAVRPLRTLGVLAELQPIAVFDLGANATFEVCLGTRSSAGSVGVKIRL